MSEGIYVVNRPKIVKVTTRSVIQLAPTISDFTFTAETDGQTEFTLESIPAQIMILSINGAAQNKAAGDYTVSGQKITIPGGVSAGDVVYGIYAEQYTPVLKDFYFTAEEGQTAFVLQSGPRIVYLACVNGAVQNSLAGDFTVDGTTITLATPLNAGDKFFGAYQE